MCLVLQRDSWFVSRNCHATHITLPSALARMAFKSSSVINLVYSYRGSQTRFEYSLILVILPPWAVFSLSLSLPPQILHIWYINIKSLNRRTVNKTSSSNPRQTRICYIFWLWVIVNALLKKVCLHLLSHFRIRIIALTWPDNKSARNQPKSCMPAMQNHTNHNDVRPISFQLKSSLPFSLFPFVWRLESTTTKSLFIVPENIHTPPMEGFLVWTPPPPTPPEIPF